MESARAHSEQKINGETDENVLRRNYNTWLFFFDRFAASFRAPSVHRTCPKVIKRYSRQTTLQELGSLTIAKSRRGGKKSSLGSAMIYRNDKYFKSWPFRGAGSSPLEPGLMVRRMAGKFLP